MIAWFVCVAGASSIRLSAESWASLFNNTDSLPVVVEFWDPWCPHCAKFRDAWSNITQSAKYDGRVIFSDVNCAADRTLCRRFEGDATPRLFWFDFGATKPRQYIGSFSQDDVEDFLDRQLRSALSDLNSSVNLTRICFVRPVFVFNISRTDVRSIEIAQKVASSKQHFSVDFFLNLDAKGHQPQLMWLSKRHRSEFVSQDWSIDELSEFADLHSLPFLSYFTSTVNHFVTSFRFSVFVFILEPGSRESLSGNRLEMADYFQQFALTTVVDCSVMNYVCRYTGQRAGGVVFWNRSAEKFWRFDGSDVEKWFRDIRQNKIRGKGPGNSTFFAYFFELRARGGFHYYIIFFPVILVGALVAVIGYAICVTAQPVHRHRDGSEELGDRWGRIGYTRLDPIRMDDPPIRR
jgi:thiol-disulfide isomerase/thioredoxin